MKLIIDIDKEEYKEVLKDTYSGTSFENKIFTAIANGIPFNLIGEDYILASALDRALDEISNNVNKLPKVSDGNKVYVSINDVFNIIDKYR